MVKVIKILLLSLFVIAGSVCALDSLLLCHESYEPLLFTHIDDSSMVKKTCRQVDSVISTDSLLRTQLEKYDKKLVELFLCKDTNQQCKYALRQSRWFISTKKGQKSYTFKDITPIIVVFLFNDRLDFVDYYQCK